MLANRSVVIARRGQKKITESRCFLAVNFDFPRCYEACLTVSVHSPVWRCGTHERFRTVAPTTEMFFRESVTPESTDACQLQARQGCTPQLIDF